MKKLFLYCFVFILAISLVFAAEGNSACTDSDGGQKPFQKGQIQPPQEGDGSNGMDYCYKGAQDEDLLLEWFCGENGPEMGIYSCPSGCEDGACIEEGGSGNQGQGNLGSGNENSQAQGSENQVTTNTANQGESTKLQVQTTSEFGSTIRSQDGNAEAKTSMKMSQGEDGKTYAELSNGMKAEVKVMPDTASEKALEVLGAKCEETGCVIELKEVGNGEEAKAAYEVKAQKEVKVLGFVKSQMRVKAQVDAETGEVIRTRNAWWGFLAKKNLDE